VNALPIPPPSLRYLVSSTFVIIVAPCVAKVKRHDTVIMKNGDRLTDIETDYFSASVGVDWLQVEKVESKATFQIVLSE
jgi:hypothetical protein